MIERQNSTESGIVGEDCTGMVTSVCSAVGSRSISEEFAAPSFPEFSPDERVVAETLAAIEEHGSLTPIIKHELKTKIQTKRCLKGQGELKIEFNKPTPKTFSEDEAKRTVERREQNRKAAERFRMRQKERAHRLLKKTEQLESKNTMLRASLADLHREKAELESVWFNHLLLCHNHQTTDG